MAITVLKYKPDTRPKRTSVGSPPPKPPTRNTTYTPHGPRLDPLLYLGTDIFHLIMSELSVRTLLTCEQVCRAWKTLRYDGRLWRNACIDGGIDDYYIHQVDAAASGRLDRWRHLCLTMLPSARAWNRGRPTRTSRLDEPDSLYTQSSFIPISPLGIFNTLDREGRACVLDSRYKRMTSWDAKYQELAVCGEYFVGGRWGMSHNDPTIIDIWKILPGASGSWSPTFVPVDGGALWHVRTLSLPLWTYTMALHQDSCKASPTLALLVSTPKWVSSISDGHWEGSNVKSVYFYDIDTGLENAFAVDFGSRSAFAVNDTHVLVNDLRHLHIYSRQTESRVATVPLTPDGAALAGPLVMAHRVGNRGQTVPAHITFASFKPESTEERTMWHAAHALANWSTGTRATLAITASGEIVYCANGALIALRDTAELLAKLETSSNPAQLASDHSVLISSTTPFQNLQVVNDRILVQTKSEVLMFNLKDLPIPLQPEPQPLIDPLSLTKPLPRPRKREVFHKSLARGMRENLLDGSEMLPVWTQGPQLKTYVYSLPGLDGAIMTPKAIYLPTSKCITVESITGRKSDLSLPGPTYIWHLDMPVL